MPADAELRIRAAVTQAVDALRQVKAEVLGVREESKRSTESQQTDASKNVASTVKQREALLALAREYTTVAESAKRGSVEQQAAAKMSAETQARANALIRETSAETQKTSGHMNLLGKTMGIVFGGAIAAKGLEDIVDVAKEAQTSQTLLANTMEHAGQSYKANRKQIEDTVDAEARLSGIQRVDLRTSFMQLDRVIVSSAGTRGAVTKATDAMNEAADIARARHISLAAATKMVSQVELGRVAQMRRIGIQLPQVTTAEDKLRDSHAKVTAEVRAQAKAWDQQQTAIAGVAALHKAYAGSAEAYGKTASGAVDRLRVSWQDFGIELGQKLLPIISAASTWLADELDKLDKSAQAHRILHDATEAVVTAYHDLVPYIRMAVAATVDIVGWFNKHRTVAEWLAGTILTVVTAYKVYKMAVDVAKAAQAAFNLVMDANPVGIIVTALAALAVGFVIAYRRSATFRDVVQDIGQVIKTNVLPALDALKTAGVFVFDFLRKHWQLVLDGFGPIGVIAGLVIKHFQAIVAAVEHPVAAIQGIWQALFTWLEKTAIEVALKIVEPFSHLPKWLGGGWAQDMKKNLQSALGNLQSTATTAGTNVGDAFAKGFQDVATQGIQSAVQNGLLNLTLTQTAGAKGTVPNIGSSGGMVQGVSGHITAGLKAIETATGGHVNDDYASSGHATNSYHYKGEAIDFAPDPSVWVKLFKNRAMFAELFGPTNMPGGGGLYHFGVQFYDAALQKEHQNHIHVAYTGGPTAIDKALGGSGGSTAVPAAADVPAPSTTDTPLPTAVTDAVAAATAAAASKSSGNLSAKGAMSLDATVKALQDKIKGVVSPTLKAELEKRAADVLDGIRAGLSPAATAKLKTDLRSLSTDVGSALRIDTATAAAQTSIDKLKKELVGMPADIRGPLKAQIARVSAEFGNVVNAKDLAKAKSDLADLKKSVADAVKLDTGVATVKTGVAAIKAQIASWPAAVKGPLATQVAQLSGVLGRVVSPKDLTAAKAGLTALKNAVTAAMNAAKAAVTAATTTFETEWGRFSDSALSAFDKVTQRAIATQRITVQMGGYSFQYGQGDLTPAAKALQDLQDQAAQQQRATASASAASALQAATSTYQQLLALGVGGQDSSGNTISQSDIETAKQGIADAQSQVDQAGLDQREADLQKQADAESAAANDQFQNWQDAYQATRDVQRSVLQDQLSDLQTALETQKTTWAGAMADITAILAQGGGDAATAFWAAFNAAQGATVAAGGQNAATAAQAASAALGAAQATVAAENGSVSSTAAAVAAARAAGYTQSVGYLRRAGVIGFAGGALVTKPTLAMIGEKPGIRRGEGVIPLDDPRALQAIGQAIASALPNMGGGVTAVFPNAIIPGRDRDAARRLARMTGPELSRVIAYSTSP